MKTYQPTLSLAKAFFIMLIAATTIISCKKDEITEETVTYEIKAPSSEFYTVSAPDKAEAGKVIEVTVNPVENVFVDELLFNGIQATEDSENTFSFEMPAESVELQVLTSSTVTVEPSSYFTGYADKDVAAEGETVTVTFTVNNINDQIGGAKVNGTLDCKLTSADLGEYIFTFKMPEGPANVKGHLEVEYLLIERVWDDNCTISMLDCINHQGTEQEFCSQIPGGLVHFLYRWDIGYDVELTVTGNTTGTDYTGEVFWSLAADNHLYQDCWAFYMPDEDVTIKAESTEKAIYAGQDFTGEYKAYWMAPGENRILTSENPTMKLDLRESSAYIVTSSDENGFDFSGLYTVTDGNISYDPENTRGDHALSGKVLENGFAFIIVDDIIENKPDNRRYYLAGKDDFKFTCATDTEYATRFLIEADRNGNKTYWFVETETKSIKEATVNFSSGNSIKENSSAIVSVDGVPYIEYTYGTDSAPAFRYCGKEAGSYTSTDGGNLKLDGFGHAEYNGTTGIYTIDAGIVTFTDGTEEIQFNINTDSHTFSEIKPAADIVLDPVYSTQTSWICVDGTVSETGRVKVAFDSDYSGNEKEGYALIKITYMDTGREKEMIGASCPYFIDETNRTVTISNVLQGTGTGWSTTRKDIVLNISNDNKTLTFADAYIFSTSSPNIYCFGGSYTQIVSETPDSAEPEAGWDGPKTYSKSGMIAYENFSPYMTGGAVSVFMDKDVDGSAKVGYATVYATINGNAIINECQPYVYDESASTLTVQSITQGYPTGAYAYDIPFTVAADKSFIEFHYSYQGSGSMYSPIGNFGYNYIMITGHQLMGE